MQRNKGRYVAAMHGRLFIRSCTALRILGVDFDGLLIFHSLFPGCVCRQSRCHQAEFGAY